jgi:hypothetical protein
MDRKLVPSHEVGLLAIGSGIIAGTLTISSRPEEAV